jgi:Na+-translocating ferredoxin:NAD+ oxidoreductase subunit C
MGLDPALPEVSEGMSTTVPAGYGGFARGIHPPERKHLAQDAAIEVLPTPDVVRIALLQHLGAPCAPTVKLRDSVALGAVVGDSSAPVSAPVHASVSGTAGRETMTTLPNGRHVPTIPIKASAEQPLSGAALYEDILGGPWPYEAVERHAPEAIIAAVRHAGLVGLGGAAFPTHIKLARNPNKPIHTLLINGCECEPYLTSDYRVMLEAPRAVVAGALLAARGAGAERIVVCVEDHTPHAADSMADAARGTSVQVRVLRTKDPQGGERQLIFAVCGQAVPIGGLPLDVGVVVLNAATAAAVARGVLRGRPLTHRVVSVTGHGVNRPANILAPIGVSYQVLINHCGGLREQAGRVVAGGPMMGFALAQLDTPVTKGTGGITVLTHDELRRSEETNCIRCGRCVDVCPMHLMPTRIALAARAGNLAMAQRFHMHACVECGCCAYTCPAGIPLVQLIRSGKVMLRKAQG